MTTHFNGSKAKSLYYNGSKIKEAWYNGSKVYSSSYTEIISGRVEVYTYLQYNLSKIINIGKKVTFSATSTRRCNYYLLDASGNSTKITNNSSIIADKNFNRLEVFGTEIPGSGTFTATILVQ